MTVMVVAMCRCGHSLRLHFDEVGACRACDCSASVRVADPASVKSCSKCGEVKPISEFHERKNRVVPQWQAWCKKCMSAYHKKDDRTPTLPKLLRTRARHRAAAELQRRHAAEFAALLETYRSVVWTEAAELAAAPAAAGHYGNTPEMARLLPGPRLPDQTLLDRIDVGRCPECIGHHDRGHRCEACGRTPQQAATG